MMRNAHVAVYLGRDDWSVAGTCLFYVNIITAMILFIYILWYINNSIITMTPVHQFLTLMVNSEISYLIWNQLTPMIKSEILSLTGYICLRWGSRDKLFPHTPTLWTPNRYGRFLQEKKVPPRYNNLLEQTVHEYCWRFKLSLEPYTELSLKQRKVSV